ncbi:MAG: ABC transporter ATP-binding protein [Patescibacteria group bacterium]|nr:ABC transporter ATP-binding protein [Patescibacteria group bacterium]
MSKTLIKVNNISKTYHLGEVKVPALKNISLTVNQGDFLIICGRNGSGKSTLMRQLALVDRPDKGEIYLNTQEMVKMSSKKRRELRLTQLGYIFQEYALIAELTALENVMLPAMMLQAAKSCRHRAQSLLEKVDLGDKINNLPSQLSGGEQQKVAIARALVNNPEIIFADEPTANLDTTAGHEVLEIFKYLDEQENHTIVMITHEADEEKYANRIIKLKDGRMV